MKVPFLDLRVLDEVEKNELMHAMETVLNHGRLVMGPEISNLERCVASYCQRKYAVAVGSGTDALYLGMRALDIGKGDEVITTSLSWIATANAISLTGAIPVFSDIRDDLNIDPNSVSRLVTEKTKAILTVNYTGKISDMYALEDIANKHNLLLIEDGSQSFGAKHKGRICGSFGEVSCISHNPMKVFSAIGDAGSILCDKESTYERLVALRYNGIVNHEICIEPSLNGKMDTLQAAVLLKKLGRLPSVISARRNNAKYFSEALQRYVLVPKEQEFEEDIYYTYTIRSSRRDELKDHLAKQDIETKIQHLWLMPDQPAYRENAQGEFLNARRIAKEVLCIPVHEKLNEAQLNHVIMAIKSFGPSLPK